MHHPSVPRHIQALFVIFLAANMLHFIHNAEYIAFYPGMPSWLTREKVYAAWAAGVCIGLAGLLLVRSRLKMLGMTLIAAYGATGIGGLAHYTLALCSEHTLAANLSIWFEVLAGLVLLLVAAVTACRSAVNTGMRQVGREAHRNDARFPQGFGGP